MDWNEFRQQLGAGTFFDHLEIAGPKVTAGDCRCLRLLTTETIYRWMKRRKGVAGLIKHGYPPLRPVLALLLERHVLNLGHRRNPQPLIEFWRWATPRHGRLHNLWEEANLPATLEPVCIRQQEDSFARVLLDCANRLTDGPRWAEQTLRRLGQARAIATDECAPNAYARVVFGWEGAVPPEFRPGLVVEFQLLARSGHDLPISPSSAVFDGSFHQALTRDVANRIGSDLRALEHSWDFLGPHCLAGSSGTMAIWLALQLACKGSGEAGRALALPPWVIVTATLDKQGQATGGGAGDVGLLTEKASLLIEEGVRVMFVSDRVPNAAWHDGETTAEQFCPGLPGAQDLHVLAIRAGEGIKELGEQVRKRRYTWPVDLAPIENEFLPRLDTDEMESIGHRFKASALHFSLKEDYIPPSYALEALEDARQRLPGRGFLYLTAPGGVGKSVLVEALEKGWQEQGPSDPVSGRTLRYAVLHGRPENVVSFLKTVVRQAENLKPDEPLDVGVNLNRCRTLPGVQGELLQVIRKAKKYRCQEQPLLLAVDGLDELTERSPDGPISIIETLPTPDQLPPGCYVLLTSRPELRETVLEALTKRLGQLAENRLPEFLQLVTIRGDEEGYREMLRTYLLRDLGEAVRPHLWVILDKSGHRFLYVRFLRDLLRLRQTDLAQLSLGELPEGDAIFPAYLDGLSTRVKGGPEAFRQWHRPIIVVMAAAFEPISRAHLRAWLEPREWDADARNQMDQALNELTPLLQEDRATLPDDSLYAIRHQDFLAWLTRPGDGEWQSGLREEGHRRIITAVERSSIAATLRDLPEPVRHHPIFYGLLHLSSHSLALGDFEHAWRCLCNSEKAGSLNDWTESCEQSWQWHDLSSIWKVRIEQLENCYQQFVELKLAGNDLTLLSECSATAHMNRGLALHSQHRFDAALFDFGRAISLRQQLFQAVAVKLGGDSETIVRYPNLAKDLAHSHYNRGGTYLFQQRFNEARADYDRAVALLGELLQALTADGEDESQAILCLEIVDHLAATHGSRALTYQSQIRFDEALSDYDRASALFETLFQALATDAGDESQVIRPHLATRLALTHCNRALTYQSQQRFDEALAASGRALTLFWKAFQAVMEEAENELQAITCQPDLADHIALTYTNRGFTYQSQLRFDEALADYDRALALFEAMFQAVTAEADNESQAITCQPGLADHIVLAHINRGLTYQSQLRFDEALADYDRALALSGKLFQAVTAETENESQAVTCKPALATRIALAHMPRGSIYHSQQRFDVALTDYDRALALFEALFQAVTAEADNESQAITCQPALANDIALAYMNRGGTYSTQQRFEEALTDCNRALALFGKLLQAVTAETQDVTQAIARHPTLVNNLAFAHLNRGGSYAYQQRFNQALADQDQAIILLEGLYRAAGTEAQAILLQPALAYHLARSHMIRGCTYRRLQRFEEALADDGRAVVLLEGLVPSVQQQFLRDLLLTVSNWCYLHHERKGTNACLNDLIDGIRLTLMVYEKIGHNIVLANVVADLRLIDPFVAELPPDAAGLPADWRDRWTELRQMCGLARPLGGSRE